MNSNVILAGTAANAAEAARRSDLAAAFVGGSSGGAPRCGAGGGGASTGNVINNIAIIGKEQVMLRVRVAELQRDVLKQFGIDTRALFSSGGLTVGFLNLPVNPLHDQPAAASPAPAAAARQLLCRQRRRDRRPRQSL